MSHALKAMELIRRFDEAAAEAQRADESERVGTVALLRVFEVAMRIVRDVAGDDAFVESLDRLSSQHDFYAWMRHPALDSLMKDHREADERRPYAYRNTLRARWAKIPRAKYDGIRYEEAEVDTFAQTLQAWQKRLMQETGPAAARAAVA